MFIKLIQIRTLIWSPLLVCRGVWDLKKLHYGSHVSDLMSSLYYDVINTVMIFLGQWDCSYHAKQFNDMFIILQSPFYWLVHKVTRVSSGTPPAFPQVKKQARIWMYWNALKCWLFGQGCEEEEKIILSPKKSKVFYKIISYQILSKLLPSKH